MIELKTKEEVIEFFKQFNIDSDLMLVMNKATLITLKNALTKVLPSVKQPLENFVNYSNDKDSIKIFICNHIQDDYMDKMSRKTFIEDNPLGFLQKPIILENCGKNLHLVDGYNKYYTKFK